MTVFQVQRRGGIFREEAAIDGAPAPSTIIAVKDTTCLVMASGFFESLKGDVQEKLYRLLYRAFCEKLVERLQESNVLILKLKEENFRLKDTLETPLSLHANA